MEQPKFKLTIKDSELPSVEVAEYDIETTVKTLLQLFGPIVVTIELLA